MISNRFFLIILTLVIVSFGFGCRSKTVVKKLVNQNASISNKSETKKIDGVMYHLPKTVVQVTIPVRKVTETPGDFKAFAPCFFSASEIEGMVKAPKKSFFIDQPSFSSRGVPDTEQTYVIKTKGKYFESKTLFVEYAPGYILQKGEAESKNETLEFTVKAIATAASVAAKLGPLALGSSERDNELLQNLREEFNCLSNLAGTNASKTAIEKEMRTILKNRVLNDKKESQKLTKQDEAKLFPSDTSIRNKVNEYNNQDDIRTEYQKALSIYTELQILEQQRNRATQNQGAHPPETYKIMMEKVTEAIAAHRAAFLGLRSKEVWAATFEFTPGADDDYSDMSFTYSPNYGVCNTGFIKKKSIRIGSGFGFAKPIQGSNDSESCTDTTEANIRTLWLNVRRSDNQTFLQRIKDANDVAAQEDKSRGWFYRIPADGDISLLSAEIPCEQSVAPAPAAVPPVAARYNCAPQSIEANSVGASKIPTIVKIIKASGNTATGLNFAGSQIAFNEMSIAQLGEVASVPASTAGRSSITTIMLDPATGAMKNFKSSSTALIDKSILDDAGKAANSAIDAADPLNRDKRRLEELKTQNQINEQEEILNNSNTSEDESNP